MSNAKHGGSDDLGAAIQGLATSVDERFEQVDARFAGVDARFDQVDARFDRLETELASTRSDILDAIDGLASQVRDAVQESVARDAKVARHDRWIHQLADHSDVTLGP